MAEYGDDQQLEAYERLDEILGRQWLVRKPWMTFVLPAVRELTRGPDDDR